jgi:hypothetical protein
MEERRSYTTLELAFEHRELVSHGNNPEDGF